MNISSRNINISGKDMNIAALAIWIFLEKISGN
jgi:hypothetical protein